MKTIAKPLTALVLLAGMGLASTAQADLIDRVFAVYDTDRNISWLKDANYAQTSGYDADGQMTWATAKTWAEGLNIGGFTDWRLPTTLQPDATCGIQDSGNSYGYNCKGSELGHLFYTEGGLTQSQNINSSVVLSNLFINMQNSIYWSSTEFAPNPLSAWMFVTDDGFQYFDGKAGFNHYAWAVRDGDVGAGSSVPEPGIIGLMGIGALAWAGTWHKRRG